MMNRRTMKPSSKGVGNTEGMATTMASFTGPKTAWKIPSVAVAPRYFALPYLA